MPVTSVVHLIFLRPISGYSSNLKDYQFINCVCYIDHYGKNWTGVVFVLAFVPFVKDQNLLGSARSKPLKHHISRLNPVHY